MTGSRDLSLLHGLDSHCREDPGSMPAVLCPVNDLKKVSKLLTRNKRRTTTTFISQEKILTIL